MSNQTDEFHGVGGSYVINEKTRKRERVEDPTKPSEGGGARDSDGKPLFAPAPPDAAADAPADKTKPAARSPNAARGAGD